MPICELCRKNFSKSVPCLKYIELDDGKMYERSTFHFEEPSGYCHDCNAPHGSYHHVGCDVERCPKCGKQLVTCGHLDFSKEEKFFGENIKDIINLVSKVYRKIADKKFLKWKQREFPVGIIVEDCRYHPCIVKSNPKHNDSLHLVSILDLSPITCCIPLCGVRKLSPTEIEEYIYNYNIKKEQ